MEINIVTGANIDESIRIYTDLGPGLLEPVNEELLRSTWVSVDSLEDNQCQLLL